MIHGRLHGVMLNWNLKISSSCLMHFFHSWSKLFEVFRSWKTSLKCIHYEKRELRSLWWCPLCRVANASIVRSDVVVDPAYPQLLDYPPLGVLTQWERRVANAQKPRALLLQNMPWAEPSRHLALSCPTCHISNFQAQSSELDLPMGFSSLNSKLGWYLRAPCKN